VSASASPTRGRPHDICTAWPDPAFLSWWANGQNRSCPPPLRPVPLPATGAGKP